MLSTSFGHAPKSIFGRGFAPDPTGGAYSALPKHLAGGNKIKSSAYIIQPINTSAMSPKSIVAGASTRTQLGDLKALPDPQLVGRGLAAPSPPAVGLGAL